MGVYDLTSDAYDGLMPSFAGKGLDDPGLGFTFTELGLKYIESIMRKIMKIVFQNSTPKSPTPRELSDVSRTPPSPRRFCRKLIGFV